MHINLEDAERIFGAQVVFQNLNYHFAEGSKTAILGGNGSGKSTLLKCLYGALSLSGGKISYQQNNKVLKNDQLIGEISFSGPYFELIEELSALEFLRTYQGFRPLSLSPSEILAQAYLEKSAQKKIKQFSSGMKQRLRLSLALFSKSSLVILDEPSANLDPKGIEWYQKLLETNLGKRSLIVGSNFSEEEIFLCHDQLKVTDYSPQY